MFVLGQTKFNMAGIRNGFLYMKITLICHMEIESDTIQLLCGRVCITEGTTSEVKVKCSYKLLYNNEVNTTNPEIGSAL
jgi:hypothetical protein